MKVEAWCPQHDPYRKDVLASTGSLTGSAYQAKKFFEHTSLTGPHMTTKPTNSVFLSGINYAYEVVQGVSSGYGYIDEMGRYSIINKSHYQTGTTYRDFGATSSPAYGTQIVLPTGHSHIHMYPYTPPTNRVICIECGITLN